jgi:flagellin
MPVNVRIVAPTSSHQDAFWASGHPASLLFPQPCNNFLSINSTLEITGPNGTASLNFPAGTGNSANIISAVNTATPTTGITAGIAGDGVSIAFNGNGRIEIKQLPPCPNHQFQDQDGNTNIDTETTVTPARVFINGVEYPIDENNNVYVNTPYLCMDMGLTQLGASINLASTFYITDGGALFQTGAVVDGQNQVRIAIPSVAPSALGNGTVGYLNQIVQSSDYALTDGHAQEADAIVLEAIRQVSVLRGRLGAFEKDILQTSVNANQITLENVTSSESRVRDTDFAIETSKMARAQILDKSGTSVMNIANHTSETILNLLKTNL